MRFDLPTSWRHGRGLAGQTGAVLGGLGCTRTLLVTDRELVRGGVLAPVTDSLDAYDGLDYTVCDAVTHEPTVALFERLDATWDLSEFDSILAVGGGSVIDAAKGLAVTADFGGHIRDYAGFGRIPAPLSRPIVAVPTTAGTGSEISDGSVWVDAERHTKFLVLSLHLCPAVAITDPEMTRSMPPSVTATSGIDALTHAIESYTSVDASVASRPFSLRAIEAIAGGLERAFADGDDLDAREDVQIGATMAMIAGMNAHMGLCHALAMPLCGLYPLPHGQACALALPHVLEFNAAAVGTAVDEVFASLGMAGDPTGPAPTERLKRFVAGLGLHARLRDLGYRDEHLEIIVRETRASAQFGFNPRPASDDDLARLVRRLV